MNHSSLLSDSPLSGSPISGSQSKSGPRQWKSYRAAIIITALILAFLYWQSPNFRFRDSATANPYAGDFMQEWIGGHIVQAGNHHRFYEVEYAQQLQHNSDLVGYHWDEDQYLPLVYPPFYYAAVSPLAQLPFHQAAWVWAGLMLLGFAASAVLLAVAVHQKRGLFGLEWQDNKQDNKEKLSDRKKQWLALLPWALPAAVLFVPLLENFTSSQKGTLCLLILTGTFLLLDRSRPFWAGVVFGLLAFKPQLTLVIGLAMLLKGQWRFVAGGALTGALLVAACLAVGSDVSWQYFQFSTTTAAYMQTSGYDLHKSHSILGLFELLRTWSDMPALNRIIAWATCLFVVAMVWKVLRKGITPGKPLFTIQFSVLVVATVLLSPHLFTYDLTILLLPMFLLTFLIAHRAISNQYHRPLSWMLVATYALVGLSPSIALLTGLQFSTFLLLGLLNMLYLEITKTSSIQQVLSLPR